MDSPSCMTRNWSGCASWRRTRSMKLFFVFVAWILSGSGEAFAAAGQPEAGEASLKLPDLSQVDFLGMTGHHLLLYGILFCFLDTYLKNRIPNEFKKSEYSQAT
jgi:hypothetical protein